MVEGQDQRRGPLRGQHALALGWSVPLSVVVCCRTPCTRAACVPGPTVRKGCLVTPLATPHAKNLAARTAGHLHTRTAAPPYALPTSPRCHPYPAVGPSDVDDVPEDDFGLGAEVSANVGGGGGGAPPRPLALPPARLDGLGGRGRDSGDAFSFGGPGGGGGAVSATPRKLQP